MQKIVSLSYFKKISVFLGQIKYNKNTIQTLKELTLPMPPA